MVALDRQRFNADRPFIQAVSSKLIFKFNDSKELHFISYPFNNSGVRIASIINTSVALIHYTNEIKTGSLHAFFKSNSRTKVFGNADQVISKQVVLNGNPLPNFINTENVIIAIWKVEYLDEGTNFMHEDNFIIQSICNNSEVVSNSFLSIDSFNILTFIKQNNLEHILTKENKQLYLK